ncbi:MAG: sulfur carrier protein ThiS [Jatrophihabitantaceae bacterium]
MIINLNGHPYEVADGTTLVALIETIAGSTRGSAAVIDNEVIPRSRWAMQRLAEGQRVELITAVQGG